MKGYTITIITINLNNQSGLKTTLESVVDQSDTDFELIVIDGASRDGSKALLDQYSTIITHSVSEPDTGIYHAMNKGIKRASGEYLLFLNSGDYLYDSSTVHKLRSALLQHEDVDILSGELELMSKDSEKETWIPPNQLSFDLFFHNTLPHPSTLIRSALFNEVGNYNESHKIASDYEWFLKAYLSDKYRFRKMDFVVSCHALSGLSSDDTLKDVIKKERYLSQRSLLRDDIWVSYQKLVDLEREHALLLSSRFVKLARRLSKLKRLLFG